MIQEPDSWRDWAAAVFATALVVVGTWWKGRLIVRRDNRSDGEAQDARDGHAQIIAQLRAEVARLSSAIDAMSARLDEETDRRRAAEAEAASLRLRVTGLELELRELRGAAT